jgi:hypothetical protein
MMSAPPSNWWARCVDGGDPIPRVLACPVAWANDEPDPDGPAIKLDVDVEGPVMDTEGVIDGFELIIMGLTTELLAEVTLDDSGVENDPMESESMLRSRLSLGLGYRTREE